MPEPIYHNIMLASGQVCDVASRRGYDKGAVKKAFAKRDRRMSKSATTTATSGGKTVNKSCDTCSIKKRRCDGGRPCSYCVRRGDGHKCTYSTRRPYTSTNRRSRLWSSSASSEQAATGTGSATSGSPCRKSSMESHCHGNNIIKQNTSGVIEASPPTGPMATPKIEHSSPANEEVYAELARAKQSVMSLIVSTNSLSLHASNNGPYQQTAMKQHPVPCCELDEACDIGVGYAEMMPRTVDQHLPPIGENTADDIKAAEAPAGEALDKNLWPLEKDEENAISAEDWFEVALIL